MPIPEDVVRARLVFSLLQGGAIADQAVMGIHLRRVRPFPTVTDWPANVNETATKLFEKWVSNVTTANYWSPQVRLEMTEAYHLNADTGKTLDKGVQVRDAQHAWVGTSGSPSLPWECATAVSLYGYAPGSFTQNARIKRGRFYLPPMSTQVMDGANGDGLYTSAVQTSLATVMAAFLNDVQGMTVGQGATPDYWNVGILSRTQNAFTPIHTVRVGRRPDSQRRRGATLAESYVDRTITPGG